MSVRELTDGRGRVRIKQQYFYNVNDITRGCTGFDGLIEDGEAVRGRTPRKKFDFKIKR